MAGSIVLKGENETRARTGDTMFLVPKDGRYLQLVKEWWQNRGGTQYCKVAVLNVTAGATTKKLAFVASQDSYVHIEHDGSFNFEFSHWRALRHAALFDDSWQLERQYVFPTSPGDAVKVLDANGQPADGPGASGGTPGTSGVTWDAGPAVETLDWSSIAYGNGTWVAVAQSGINSIIYSTDSGATWTGVPSPAAGTLKDVGFGGGKFVAVGTDGLVIYSSDGATWQAATAPEANKWFSVTYGDGKYVAVSNNGTQRVMYSSDAVTWTGATAGAENGWRAVTFGNGTFVATANNGTNRCMYSTDAINWTAVVSDDETADCRAITFGNGRFVRVSVSGNAANLVGYSDDGITWTAANATGNQFWYGVTYGDGKFVAVSSSETNRVMYSTDGITWTATQGNQDDSSWRGVAFGENEFIAVAAHGSPNSIMISKRT